LHQESDRKTGGNPPAGSESVVVKIPEDKIFGGPKREESDKRCEGLVRAASRIRDEHVKPKQHEKKEREKMKQNQHELEHRPNRGSRAIRSYLSFTFKLTPTA
jgi:hypothetical protein